MTEAPGRPLARERSGAVSILEPFTNEVEDA
jgi:hypothetical protein